MQPGSKSCLTMTNVTTAATLRHPGAIHQLEGIAREAVRIHTAEVVAFANHYGHPIPWEYRLRLFARPHLRSRRVEAQLPHQGGRR